MTRPRIRAAIQSEARRHASSMSHRPDHVLVLRFVGDKVRTSIEPRDSVELLYGHLRPAGQGEFTVAAITRRQDGAYLLSDFRYPLDAAKETG